jgi:DNA-binding PadR family transcriptional regulator
MRADAVKGHLDSILLASLEGKPQHGYAIIEAVKAGSRASFDLPTGTLYPALHRLERAGLVRSKWSMVSGRRRRTYELTERGRRKLGEERQSWKHFSRAVSNLLGGAPTGAMQ